MRLGRSLLVLAVAFLVTPLPPTAAQSSTPPWTRTDFMLNGAGGVQLAASVWVPNGPGPFPAVIETNGWNNRHDAGTELEFAEHFASAGYVVLGFTSRGWGNSGGEIELDGPNEQNDTRAAIDLLASKSSDWHVLMDPGPDPSTHYCNVSFGQPPAPVSCQSSNDPRVGMVGQSYAGGIQLLTAQADPRLDSLIPHITWSNLLDALAPEDVAKVGWISLLYGTGQTVSRGAPLTGHPGNPDGNGPSEKLTEWYAELMGTNAPTDEIRYEVGWVRSLHPGQLRTPTFLIQGWQDTLFMPNQALATYQDLVSRNVTARVLFYPGGHGISLPNTDPAWLGLYPFMEDWFNVTLRHRLPTLPPYPVVRWSYATAPAAGSYLGEVQWPPAGTTTWRGYLAGTGLDADLGKATSSVQLVNPVIPADCVDPSNFQDQATFCPYAAPDTFQVYAGPETSTDEELTGQPTAHLVISSTQPSDVRLFVALADVDASGTATTILRQVVPVHLAAAAAATPVNVTLQAITHTLPAGHRIGLRVATTEVSYAASRVPGQITVASSPAAPSWVDVPVVAARAWGDHTAPAVRVNVPRDIVANETFNVMVDARDDLDVPMIAVSTTAADGRVQAEWRNTTGRHVVASFNLTLPAGTHALSVFVQGWPAHAMQMHVIDRVGEPNTQFFQSFNVTVHERGSCAGTNCTLGQTHKTPWPAGSMTMALVIALAAVAARRVKPSRR
jgi:predicted acyl esterase